MWEKGDNTLKLESWTNLAQSFSLDIVDSLTLNEFLNKYV